VFEDEIGPALDDQVADFDAQRHDRKTVFDRQTRDVGRRGSRHVIERTKHRETLMNFAHVPSLTQI
jgi:hypothetical protein